MVAWWAQGPGLKAQVIGMDTSIPLRLGYCQQLCRLQIVAVSKDALGHPHVAIVRGW